MGAINCEQMVLFWAPNATSNVRTDLDPETGFIFHGLWGQHFNQSKVKLERGNNLGGRIGRFFQPLEEDLVADLNKYWPHLSIPNSHEHLQHEFNEHGKKYAIGSNEYFRRAIQRFKPLLDPNSPRNLVNNLKDKDFYVGSYVDAEKFHEAVCQIFHVENIAGMTITNDGGWRLRELKLLTDIDGNIISVPKVLAQVPQGEFLWESFPMKWCRRAGSHVA